MSSSQAFPAIKSNRKGVFIPLPFKDISSLPEEQLLKLIRDQGRVLHIYDWEIDCLIELCQPKRCLAKGLGVLSEYARLQDAVNTALESQRNGMDELFSHIENSETLDISKISYLLDSIARDLLSMYVSLSSLRKLQWSPNPFVPLGSEAPTSSSASLPVQARAGARRLLDLLLPSASADTSAAMTPNLLQTLSLRKELQLGIILCSALTDRELGDLFLDLSSDSSGSTSAQKLRIECGRNIRKILAVEDRICKTWETFTAAFPGGQGQLLRLLPVLRLPYENLRLPVSDLDWFSETIATGEVYQSAIPQLNSCIQFLSSVPFEAENSSLGAHDMQLKPLSVKEGSNQAQDTPPLIQRKKSKSVPVRLSKDLAVILKNTEPKRHTHAGALKSNIISLGTPAQVITKPSAGMLKIR